MTVINIFLFQEFESALRSLRLLESNSSENFLRTFSNDDHEVMKKAAFLFSW